MISIPLEKRETHSNRNDSALLSPLLPGSVQDIDNSDADFPKKDSGRSIPPQVACTLNLANTLMGAGMLGLPHALANSGMAVGVTLTVLSAFFSGMGLHLLARSARKVGNYPTSFYTVTQASVPWATVLIDFAVAVKCWGVGTSYFIVFGDMMPRALHKLDHGVDEFWLQREIWITAACALVLPLVYAKSLHALRYTSLLSIGFILFTTALSVGYAFKLDLPECSSQEVLETSCKGITKVSTDVMDTLNVFSIFVFSFTCQQNVFNVSNELIHCTKRQVDRVIWVTILMSLGIYLTFSIFGYLTFGDVVQSDIFDSYPNSLLVTIGRIFISLMVTFSYPLQAHPARSSMISLLEVCINKGDSVHWKRIEHFVISSIIVFGSYAIALNVEDLGIVLSVIGATGSTTVTYILPGLVYRNLYFKIDQSWKKYYALLHLLVGLTIVPVCLVFIFYTK